MERNRVLIAGLPGEDIISTSDLVMYFQSKKKSGGGEVTNVERLHQGQAILTFQNEVVAQNVLARLEHNVKGFLIQTMVPPRNMRRVTPAISLEDVKDDSTSEENSSSDEDEVIGNPEELCTVQVMNLSATTTKDSIQNYFENKKKSKGGPVRRVELKSTLNMAIVVFQFREDAKGVANYHKHKLDKARLSISLLNSKPCDDKGKKHDQEPKKGVREASTEDEMALEFVVSGISELTTEDALTNYLENTRRSGGGDVEKLIFYEEEGVAEVKFKNVQNLDQLLGDQHRLDDSRLCITVKEPEKTFPSDPLKVHVTGLNPATTKDGLELYMEKMSEKDVQNVQFGTYCNALISFKEAPDFDAMTKRIQENRKRLEGCKPTCERVPYCCCVQVSGLHASTTEDAIKLYFESPKKGCGAEPSKVDIQGQGKALVYFDDPSVIDNALSKRHELDKAELKVEMFYPFLTEEKITEKKAGKCRETTSVEVEPNVMAHIMKNFSDDLQKLQEETSIEVEWSSGETSAKMKGRAIGRDTDEPWRSRVNILQKYFDEFECRKLDVEPALWDEVTEVVVKEIASTNDVRDIEITTDDTANEIIITGRKGCLQMAANAVKDRIDGIQEDKALQESIDTKVEEDLETGKLALLEISDLYINLQTTYKHVKIDVCKEKGQLTIQGPKKRLQEINVEMYKFFSKIKEEVLELPERVLKVLETPSGRDFVCGSLLENEIKAVLVHGERKSKNEASIFAINKEQARQASNLINSFSTEKSIHLNEENIQVINTSKWKDFVAKLETQSMVSIYFEAQAQTLWISGIEPDAKECFKTVEDYIERNTILKDIIEVRDGCSRFIFQKFDNEIKELQAEMRDAVLTIQPSEDGEVMFTGTRDGIEKGKERVISLIDQVCDKEIKIDKPGIKKFFKSSKGSKVIKAIEVENNCTVELIDLDELEQGSDTLKETGSLKRVTNGQIICSYTSNERKKLVVYKDDLTKHHVDVIVNAANENLQHVGGLARAIVREGGQGIQDECDRFIKDKGSLVEGHVMETGPGQLPCKRIIHAVGPRWESAFTRGRENGSTRKERLLQFTFENCLEKAKNFKSIAIPAVSAGIFGFPLDRCARILVETVTNFFRQNPHCNLSEVHLTNNDDVTVKAFSDEMKRMFGKEAGFRKGETKASPIYSSALKPSSRSPPASSEDKILSTPEGMSVLVKVGDISTEKADVLVNTAGRDLNLQNNACARSFSKAAGPKLQKYCSKIAPVEVGDIGVTKPGNLSCEYVFHTVCGDWDRGNGEKMLRGILQECLNEADERGANSIAIPAIGTGVLQFPRNVVARISLEEVFSFSKSRASNLKEVIFVLYDKDQPTVQAFRDEVAKSSTSPKSFMKTKKRASSTSNNLSMRKRKENWFEVDMEELSVHVQKGDITQERTDAIVVVSNPDLDLEVGGGAGAAILKAGGVTLNRECQRHPTLQPGEVSMTSAGGLGVSKLIHFVPSSNHLTEADLIKIVLDCLKYAEQKGLSSVSFPAIGTGNLRVDPDCCAKAMFKAFSKFSKQKPTSMQLVRVVIYQQSIMKDFHSKMKELVGEIPDKSESPGLLRRLTNYIGLTTEEDKEVEKQYNEGSDIVLRVYSDDPSHLDTAALAIKEIINENCKRQIINNDAIAYLEQDDLRKIHTLEHRYDCKIEIEFQVCRMIVQGNSEDVLSALSAIHDLLHEVTGKINKLQQAELLAKDVEWQYETDDGFESYSKELNAKIEQAYANKKTEVTFEEDEEEFKIKFSQMTEYSSRGKTKVKRKNLSPNDISLPDYWDPQPTTKTGKEETVYLVDLKPNKQVQEYLKVSDLVKKTLPSSNKVKRIQRVQNPAQYKIYAVRKQKMNEENSKGSNEKLLFHGTPQSCCDSINHEGFNRSYGGRNATLYGQGVYFAVDASYSARSNYSPPDSQGNRYMYLARVLTGDYTVGDQSMAVAPPKDPSKPTVKYDTVVDDMTNPSIFVAFYDGQCYPEYLITFQ